MLEKFWDSVWGQLLIRWGIPIVIGSLSIPIFKDVYMPQIIAATLGIIMNASFGRRWYIAFSQLIWFVGSWGYSGYLTQIGYLHDVGVNGDTGYISRLAGVSGTFWTLGILSFLLGIGLTLYLGFQGAGSSWAMLKNVLMFWKKDKEKVSPAKMVYFLVVVALLILAFLGVFGKLLAVSVRPGYNDPTAPVTYYYSGMGPATSAFLYIALLTGIATTGYWTFVGLKESGTLISSGWKLISESKGFQDKMHALGQWLAHLLPHHS